MTTKTKPKKKKAGNTKIYDIAYILGKYNLTPPQFQELAQEVFTGDKIKHVTAKGITSFGLVLIGKAMKKRKTDKAEAVIQKELEAPIVRELITCGQPPNKNKLWCKCPHTGSKVVVNVPRKIHLGYKPGVKLMCEKINDGLFVFPAMANA